MKIRGCLVSCVASPLSQRHAVTSACGHFTRHPGTEGRCQPGWQERCERRRAALGPDVTACLCGGATGQTSAGAGRKPAWPLELSTAACQSQQRHYIYTGEHSSLPVTATPLHLHGRAQEAVRGRINNACNNSNLCLFGAGAFNFFLKRAESSATLVCQLMKQRDERGLTSGSLHSITLPNSQSVAISWGVRLMRHFIIYVPVVACPDYKLQQIMILQWSQ